MQRPQDRDAALNLLRAFVQRRALYLSPGDEAQNFLREMEASERVRKRAFVQWSAELKGKGEPSRRITAKGAANHIIEWKVSSRSALTLAWNF